MVSEELCELGQIITEELMSLWREHQGSETLQCLPYARRVLPALWRANPRYGGIPLQEWVMQQFDSDKPSEQIQNCLFVAGIDKIAAATPQVLQALVTALTDKDRSVRSSALSALRSMGSSAVTPQVLQALVMALHDENREVRSSAAEVIAKWEKAEMRFFAPHFSGSNAQWRMCTALHLSKA